MKFLGIFGGEYWEIEAGDYWKAQSQAGKDINQRYGTKLPLKMVKTLPRVIKLEDKYSVGDLLNLVAALARGSKGGLMSDGPPDYRELVQ